MQTQNIIIHQIEMLNAFSFLKVIDIEKWLVENRVLLNKAIEDTSCHKWKKWKTDNNLHIFPCITHLCLPLNVECRFIEFYKKLQDFIQTIRTEDFYNNQLEIYERLKHNQNAVFEWIIDIKKYGNELTLIKNEICFNDENDKKYLTFKIDKTELQNLWKFKEIYDENYYSIEFENYIPN